MSITAMSSDPIEAVELCALCSAVNGGSRPRGSDKIPDSSSNAAAMAYTSISGATDGPSSDHPEADSAKSELGTTVNTSLTESRSTPSDHPASMSDCPMEVLEMIYDGVLEDECSRKWYSSPTGSTQGDYAQVFSTTNDAREADDMLTQAWHCLANVRLAHPWLASTALEFLVKLVQKYDREQSHFRKVSFEVSVSSMVRLQAVTNNPTLAGLVSDITLIEHLPLWEITNKQEFMNRLFRKSSRYPWFSSRPQEAQEAWLLARWMQAEEQFFEVQHILRCGHFADSLQGLANLPTLQTFRYQCLRFLSGSITDRSFLNEPPEKERERERISVNCLKKQGQYPALENLLEALGSVQNVTKVVLMGVDCGIGSLSHGARATLTTMISQSHCLVLECYPDWIFGDTRRKFDRWIARSRHMIASATQVQQLGISHDPFRIEDLSSCTKARQDPLAGLWPSILMRIILNDCAFPLLEAVDMQWLRFLPHEIRGFLQRNGQGLSKLLMTESCVVRDLLLPVYTKRPIEPDDFDTLRMQLENLAPLKHAYVWLYAGVYTEIYMTKKFQKGDRGVAGRSCIYGNRVAPRHFILSRSWEDVNWSKEVIILGEKTQS